MRYRSIIVGLTFVSLTSWSMAQADDIYTPPATLPPVTVTATNKLAEEALVGPNQQPEWTARRRFAFTRIYVQPPWQMETEFGWDAVYPRGGSPQHTLQQEFELGLPYRFQIDYEIHGANFVEGDAGGGRWRYDSSEFELRWAVANWGKIPFNPTLKAEWKHENGGTDAYEFNVLLGDELAPGWHWGVDGFYEQRVNGDRRSEFAASAAASYSVIDDKLGVGVESKFSDENDIDDRNPHWTIEVGPSVQWRPTPRTHLELASLFGVSGFAPNLETFVFFGVDFGPGSETAEGVTPASLRMK